MQTRIWLESPFWNAAEHIIMDPVNFGSGYSFTADGTTFEPKTFEGPRKPLDFLTLAHARNVQEGLVSVETIFFVVSTVVVLTLNRMP